MSHSTENLKKGTLWDFLTFVVPKYETNWKGPFGDMKKNFRKKSHKTEKGESLIVSKKVRKVPKTFGFGILVRKLAHTHGFDYEPSGLKSKHLTTRPRTPELYDLRAETRVSRTLSHNTRLSQV